MNKLIALAVSTVLVVFAPAAGATTWNFIVSSCTLAFPGLSAPCDSLDGTSLA